MTCSDVERVLPELLDGAPDGVFQSDFDAHLKTCPACSDLVSDLKLIESGARRLEATEEPAPVVWLRIAAQLRAEGVIREPDSRPILVPNLRGRRWNSWWLVPVAAMLLAAGSYVVSHKAFTVAKQQTPTPTTSLPEPPTVAQAPADSTPGESSPPQDSAQMEPRSSQAVDVARTEVRPKTKHAVEAVDAEANAEDQQFLRAVSTRAPSMRATYENQLQTVNTFIRESQAYLDQNPADADARQNLMDAYQQKALLYQIALDRIQ